MWKNLFKRKGFLGQVDNQLFNLVAGQSVLESILNADIEVPYECFVGTCMTCMCRIESGETSSLIELNHIISPEKIKLGYVLACQAIPQSDLTICTLGYSDIDNRSNMIEGVTDVD